MTLLKTGTSQVIFSMCIFYIYQTVWDRYSTVQHGVFHAAVCLNENLHLSWILLSIVLRLLLNKCSGKIIHLRLCGLQFFFLTRTTTASKQTKTNFKLSNRQSNNHKMNSDKSCKIASIENHLHSTFPSVYPE